MAHILRFPRSDQDDSFVLVRVTSSGRQSLDLKLVGTEGDATYVVQVKQSRLSTLQSKNSQCSDTEWCEILEYILLGKKDGGRDVSNIEAVAVVAESKSITITIRRRIEGITQRLGILSLIYDEDEVVELFDWCGTATQDTATSVYELSSLQKKHEDLKTTNKKLQAQLDDFIKVKKDNETELLEKFCTLLNEKKVKIRDQQRLLASTDVNPDKLKQIQADGMTKSRVADKSRRGKRKGGATAEEVDSEDDAGFEKMNIDTDQVSDDSDKEGAITPDADDDEGETADEDEELPLLKPSAKDISKVSSSRSESSAHTRSVDKPQDITKAVPAESEKEKTPPRRDLPFLRKSTVAPIRSLQADDGEETASEDDEL